MSHPVRFAIRRGDDESGALVDYTVEVNEGEVVFDVVHRLQATAVPDLAVRRKAGKCGSCSAEVYPEHIKITDNATIAMKERVADQAYDPLVWLGTRSVDGGTPDRAGRPAGALTTARYMVVENPVRRGPTMNSTRSG